MNINREAYIQGFTRAIGELKKMAEDDMAAQVQAEGSSAEGGNAAPAPTPPSVNATAALSTTVPFGYPVPPATGNLVEQVLKDSRFSQGPAATVSGSGTSNYPG